MVSPSDLEKSTAITILRSIIKQIDGEIHLLRQKKSALEVVSATLSSSEKSSSKESSSHVAELELPVTPVEIPAALELALETGLSKEEKTIGSVFKSTL